MFAQHAIACVLCELLCLELFTVFFQHENRFRYKFFRYCSIFKVLCAVALRLTTWLFYHRSGFLSSSFFRGFWTFWTWIVLNISVSAGVFERLLVLFKGFVLRLQKSFFCLSAWRSSIIPHSRFPVNTFWQVFWKKSEFSSFSCILQIAGTKTGRPCIPAQAACFYTILLFI